MLVLLHPIFFSEHEAPNFIHDLLGLVIKTLIYRPQSPDQFFNCQRLEVDEHLDGDHNLREPRWKHVQELLDDSYIFDRLAQSLEISNEIGYSHTKIIYGLPLLELDVLEILQEFLGIHFFT